ncbi:arginase family enzyme [Pullulanibacillus pueri]|uniref:Arginase n=2 Tax=Pullulanibacillus pueri TaxID=1437324 RepID=A0A8J2ZU02_9BACL|nr:arginase family enzyme [Pullulanibacillus pueri]GGH78174.1 arginase [Pullulanibacillus pueri]
MNHPKVTLLNLDGTYETQRQLQKLYDCQSIELSDIKGKNLYCDDLAFQQLTTRIAAHPVTPITLLGSGNYHYLSYYYLSQIQDPFTLILIDHHTDMYEQEQWLTCGSWVARALRTLPQLDQVIMVGVEPDSITSIQEDLRSRVHLLEEHTLKKDLYNLNALMTTSSIYLSIDKDAFSEAVVKTNWSQGCLTLDSIQPLLSYLTQHFNLIGTDICGEWPVAPEKRLLSMNQIYIQKNEKANLDLIHRIQHTFFDSDGITRSRQAEPL